jgi:hypothetical protein
MMNIYQMTHFIFISNDWVSLSNSFSLLDQHPNQCLILNLCPIISQFLPIPPLKFLSENLLELLRS